MEVTFARAMDKDKVLQLKDLNAGFTRPDTISLAYYEASLLVDHIVATRGQQGSTRWCAPSPTAWTRDGAEARAQRRPGDGCRRASTRRSTRSSARCAARSMTWKRRWTRARSRSLKMAAAANPESYMAQLALGQALAEAGDPSAFAPLQRASVLVPSAIGTESPHALMAALAEKLNDRPRAIKEYEALLSSGSHQRRGGAQAPGRWRRRPATSAPITVALDRIVRSDPFDPPRHSGAGRLALKRREHTVAMREFRRRCRPGRPTRPRRTATWGKLPRVRHEGRGQEGSAGGARNRAELSSGHRNCYSTRWAERSRPEYARQTRRRGPRGAGSSPVVRCAGRRRVSAGAVRRSAPPVPPHPTPASPACSGRFVRIH
jgi:hypothetical protein